MTPDSAFSPEVALFIGQSKPRLYSVNSSALSLGQCERRLDYALYKSAFLTDFYHTHIQNEDWCCMIPPAHLKSDYLNNHYWTNSFFHLAVSDMLVFYKFKDIVI